MCGMQFANVMCLFTILHVVCFIVLVNCLLNAFVICLGILWLNVMVQFCVWVGLFPSILCMVFNSVCVTHCLFKCFLQMSVLCY